MPLFCILIYMDEGKIALPFRLFHCSSFIVKAAQIYIIFSFIANFGWRITY